MPIDFNALPARVAVPTAQSSLVRWLIALVIIMAVGAALSIATWTAGRATQTLWFWTRTFGLPFLVWVFIYCGWRFLLAHRRRHTLADNAAIARREDRLHHEASVPFAVIGQSWCISAISERNRLEDAMNAGERADDPSEVRGLVIPGKPFFPGNRADEALRHAALLEWLLIELLKPLVRHIHNAGHRHAIAIRLCINSELTPESTRESVARAWPTLGLTHPERVELVEMMSLYAVDDWLDNRVRTPLHLAIAVQLRGAISEGLKTGEAEGAAAVLLAAQTGHEASPTDAICAHRPAKSADRTIGDGMANALRWGRCDDGKIDRRWDTGLAEPLEQALKRLDNPVNDASAVNLPETVGNAGVATPWLALALAAARAKESAGAQFILDQHDGELVAMICRKKI